uniref:(northern house mosquito) hypothetical protein n=1 Tax=Culex pipiens TaxID=7175 RepID=A0A8D8ASL6_CULPI
MLGLLLTLVMVMPLCSRVAVDHVGRVTVGSAVTIVRAHHRNHRRSVQRGSAEAVVAIVSVQSQRRRGRGRLRGRRSDCIVAAVVHQLQAGLAGAVIGLTRGGGCCCCGRRSGH